MLNKINKLSRTEFTEVFGNIFENASWIAEKLYEQKPFNDFQHLQKTILGIFTETNKEQSNAGLDQCSEEEFNEFKNLNLEYKKKFGFPFIIAVKGKNKSEILINFRKRILSEKKIEFDEAIQQVRQIASLRLEELKNNFS